MKKIILCLLLAGIVTSCGKAKKEETISEVVETVTEEVKKELAPISNAMMENAVIYEANIRQYSEEGSFKAFTKDIPVLNN